MVRPCFAWSKSQADRQGFSKSNPNLGTFCVPGGGSNKGFLCPNDVIQSSKMCQMSLICKILCNYAERSIFPSLGCAVYLVIILDSPQGMRIIGGNFQRYRNISSGNLKFAFNDERLVVDQAQSFIFEIGLFFHVQRKW